MTRAFPQTDLFQVLDDAQADTESGRYEDALAKYRWFHAHALRHDRSMAGVRLSFAISSWFELGKKHPPAMAELKRTRDAAERKVLRTDNENLMPPAFQEFAAINDWLREQTRTVRLFAWLDAERPKQAERVFNVARPALVKAKAYGLCNRHIQEDDYHFILHIYKLDKRMESKPSPPSTTLTKAQEKSFLKFRAKLSEKNFIHRTATLVALLARNNRHAEAKRVCVEAKRASANGVKFTDMPGLNRALSAAQKGRMPKSPV